jgi:hypothetical protein
VAQSPDSRAIPDLGGGGKQALSHLFHMGYPYVPEVHTIVDIYAAPKRRTNPDDEDNPLELWKAGVDCGLSTVRSAGSSSTESGEHLS